MNKIPLYRVKRSQIGPISSEMWPMALFYRYCYGIGPLCAGKSGENGSKRPENGRKRPYFAQFWHILVKNARFFQKK